MQSLYKVIKSTVIEGSNIITTPVIEIPPEPVAESNDGSIPEDYIPSEYDTMLLETQQKIDAMLSDARNEAELFIEKAKLEAVSIHDAAREEGYQEGYRNGYKDGYDFGMKEAGAEGEKIRQEAETYLHSAHEEVNSFILKSQKDIVKLSVEIARHILYTELTINSEAIYKIAEKAVSKSVDKKQIVIKVNPEDLNYLKNKKDELSIYVEDSNNIFIIADPTIKRTSLRLESPSGFVDASIDTQLDIILKSLTGEGYDAES